MARHSFLLTALLLAACPAPIPPDGDDLVDFDEAKSDAPHDEDPQVSSEEAAALADANHALAIDLYQLLREGQAAKRGFAVSPYSLQIAFGMVYGGTVEPASSEMAKALHFPLPGERQHVGNNWLGTQLSARNLPALDDHEDPVRVEAANGVWIRDDLASKIAPSYLDLLAVDYDAGVYLARFSTRPEIERMGINAWVAERTHDLIPELLPAGVITTLTRIVLVDALYVEAPWLRPFDEALTTDRPFTRLDGSKLDVPMMHAGDLEADYAAGEGWKALALPMRGEALELVIIVPDEFESFEAGLDVAMLDGVLAALSPEIVDAKVPRFEVDAPLELTAELRALGMNAPFDDPHSFDAILDDLGVITTVAHRTVIEVDEQGLQAAAATGVVVGKTSALEPTASIVVDRPFVLAIRDRPTDALLFLGRVLEP